MLASAFDTKPVRQLSESGFKDVPADYWAASVVEEAYETGFLQGYPNNLFLPNQEISKAEAITALVNGLGLTASDQDSNLLQTYYTDYESIPRVCYGRDRRSYASKSSRQLSQCQRTQSPKRL